MTADLVCFLGPNTAVKKIISKLETVYDTVLGYDVLMQHFYGVHIKKLLSQSELLREQVISYVVTRFKFRYLRGHHVFLSYQ